MPTLGPRAIPHKTIRKRFFALTGRHPYGVPVPWQIWQAVSGHQVLMLLPILAVIARMALRFGMPLFEVRLLLSIMLPCLVRSRKLLGVGEARLARKVRDWCH